MAGALMRGRLIFLLIVFSSCAVNRAFIPIQYRFTDHPAEHRIELSYRNDSRLTMCLLPEHWPNAAGKINQASGTVFLIVGQKRFPIEDFNTGYCPGGCARRVAPGEAVFAFISYSDFSLPDEFVNAQKQFEFSPAAFRCATP